MFVDDGSLGAIFTPFFLWREETKVDSSEFSWQGCNRIRVQATNTSSDRGSFRGQSCNEATNTCKITTVRVGACACLRLPPVLGLSYEFDVCSHRCARRSTPRGKCRVKSWVSNVSYSYLTRRGVDSSVQGAYVRLYGTFLPVDKTEKSGSRFC